MTPATMRVARLHGVGDLRVESVPVPQPSRGELLVRIGAPGATEAFTRALALATSEPERRHLRARIAAVRG